MFSGLLDFSRQSRPNQPFQNWCLLSSRICRSNERFLFRFSFQGQWTEPVARCGLVERFAEGPARCAVRGRCWCQGQGRINTPSPRCLEGLTRDSRRVIRSWGDLDSNRPGGWTSCIPCILLHIVELFPSDAGVGWTDCTSFGGPQRAHCGGPLAPGASQQEGLACYQGPANQRPWSGAWHQWMVVRPLTQGRNSRFSRRKVKRRWLRQLSTATHSWR